MKELFKVEELRVKVDRPLREFYFTSDKPRQRKTVIKAIKKLQKIMRALFFWPFWHKT